jgi:hypothetical protein
LLLEQPNTRERDAGFLYEPARDGGEDRVELERARHLERDAIERADERTGEIDRRRLGHAISYHATKGRGPHDQPR